MLSTNSDLFISFPSSLRAVIHANVNYCIALNQDKQYKLSLRGVSVGNELLTSLYQGYQGSASHFTYFNDLQHVFNTQRYAKHQQLAMRQGAKLSTSVPINQHLITLIFGKATIHTLT